MEITTKIKRCSNGASFGFAVGISNGYAIIGAYQEDIGNKTDAEAAYIYERASDGTWNLAQRSQGGKAGDNFGRSVEISNGYAIAGAPHNGTAYIYRRDINEVTLNNVTLTQMGYQRISPPPRPLLYILCSNPRLKICC